jgi:L-serine kinase (ADP)
VSDDVEFALVPLDALRAHERVVPSKVRALQAELRRSGVFVDPVWVARGSLVILNGHHRVAALRGLGAVRIPAWVVEYDSDLVSLGRWTPGPPISKEEVVRHAREGALFPPRTTRHRFSVDLPHQPTPLSELLDPDGRSGSTVHGRPASTRRSSRARSTPPG